MRGVSIRWDIFERAIEKSPYNFREIAAHCGVSGASMTGWRKRKKIPGKHFNSLCELLNITPASLLPLDLENLQKTSIQESDLKSRFLSHQVGDDGLEHMKEIRRKGLDLASAIDALCPKSKEKSHALTQLQGVIMYANHAIAKKYPTIEI